MKQPLALEKWPWQQRYVDVVVPIDGERPLPQLQHQHVFSGALKLPS